MAWVYLVVASIFEIGWAIALKYTEGFRACGRPPCSPCRCC
ncbi:MAG: hypothetical protein OJF52_004040 [Nitrospira sp.]|jgi:quaternary ammonium compound-resistance protein SugE|nr:MAG: hypothetical protein OJF52_004040 [Nitrospira sp.]